MARITATLKGLQEAQTRNLRRIAAVTRIAPQAVRDSTIEAHRYAVYITHVDTGAWRATHRMEVRGTEGKVYLAPSARNPRTRVPVSVYARVWEKRGGRLAVYQRVVQEAGPDIERKLGVRLVRVITE